MENDPIRAADLPQVSIRALQSDIDAWRAAARADKRSLSAWLRMVANKAARQAAKAAEREAA